MSGQDSQAEGQPTNQRGGFGHVTYVREPERETNYYKIAYLMEITMIFG